MVRFTMLAVALLVLTGTSNARGQDTDEVKKLKKEVELLERELKVARVENEQLKREIEQLKAAKTTTKKEEPQKKTLSELLPTETTLSGDYAGEKAGSERGTFAVTITERTGNKVKGTWLAKPDMKEAYPEREIVGEISDNKLVLRPVNTVTKWTCTMYLKGQALEGYNVFPDGNRVKVALKVAK
ncbi:hypothetical protein [Fimbriiglobus ruber]|uniref:Secreted protein n=1 Tax=Fimbriiglobus ruber TaxID=1908690 RepID=A0A225D6D7_9BACT|nr:hypothetical protein [Fimbriiglobus ruber]OWK35204.1 hypothetical protein FRUB_10046 [Fimbriiglobus ruber]